MNRRSLARIPATLLALALVAAAGTTITNCADRRPEDASYGPTAPQFAATSPCTETPCVRVTVSFKGGDPPADEFGNPVPVVVTLVHVKTPDGEPGAGPFDAAGEPLMLETDAATGVVTFQPSGADPRTLLPGYYCGHARPLTEVSVATGGTGRSYVVPNAESPPPQAAKYVGLVTASRGREAVLNGPNYIDCLRNPPLEVTSSSTLNLGWTMNAADASLDVLCRFFDGAPDDPCSTWAIFDLSELIGTADEPQWWELEPGVKPGLLVSAAHASQSRMYGLAPDQQVEVEATLEIEYPNDDNEEFTASLEDKPTPKSKKKSSTSTEATAFMDPLVCVDNSEPAEPEGDATWGIDFLTVHDGYYGKLPLNGPAFVANPYRTAIWYYQLELGGTQQVKIHLRFKPNPDSDIYEDPTLPQTISRQFTVDFSGCPLGQPTPTLIEDDVVTVRVECREQDDMTRVTWSFRVLGSRTMEYRLEALSDPEGPSGAQYDTHPGPARSGDDINRAMRLIEYWAGDCPLDQSTIGQSNDPKWWIPN